MKKLNFPPSGVSTIDEAGQREQVASKEEVIAPKVSKARQDVIDTLLKQAEQVVRTGEESWEQDEGGGDTRTEREKVLLNAAAALNGKESNRDKIAQLLGEKKATSPRKASSKPTPPAAKAAPPGQRVNPRRPSGDVLTEAAIREGRRVGNTSQIPPGANRVEQDVVELPITRKKKERGVARYKSVDGNSYMFRFLVNGKLDQNAVFKCVFAAIREMHLGGDARVVLDAFRVNISDDDGKPLFPMEAPGTFDVGLGVYETEDAEEESIFGLGE